MLICPAPVFPPHPVDFKDLSTYSLFSIDFAKAISMATHMSCVYLCFSMSIFLIDYVLSWISLVRLSREHGVVGDMRDAWPNARVRKNVSLIRTYHGFKGIYPSHSTAKCSIWWISFHSSSPLGDKQGTLEFLKLIFRALCLCWDRQTQDLHVDWILFRGRSLIPVSCEIVSDNVDGHYPSSHYPIFAEFMLPRSVRPTETPTQDQN